MSSLDIKQISMVTPIPEKLQHVQQQQEDVNQRNFAMQFQEQARQKEKETRSAGQLQDGMRTEDKPGEKGGKKKKKKGKKPDEETSTCDEAPSPPEREEGKWIDVVA